MKRKSSGIHSFQPQSQYKQNISGENSSFPCIGPSGRCSPFIFSFAISDVARSNSKQLCPSSSWKKYKALKRTAQLVLVRFSTHDNDLNDHKAVLFITQNIKKNKKLLSRLASCQTFIIPLLWNWLGFPVNFVLFICKPR